MWLALVPGALAQEGAGQLLQVEAARADWDSQGPPGQGWTPVDLPDRWSDRWPGHDGVVWYRFRWQEPATPRPRGLRLDSVSLAAAFYVNGQAIGRDSSLKEPLSRSWNLPRYWWLGPPLLRSGDNELWVRVSGLSAFQPGLGVVRLGQPGAMLADFEAREFQARSVHWIGLGLALVMGVLFGMLWLLRTSETPYGWFSLFSVFWALYAYNQVARSVWPFGTTAGFQQANQLLLLGSVVAFAMFVLELTGRGGRGARLALGFTATAGAALVLLVTGPLEAGARDLVVLLALAIFLAGCGVIAVQAWQSRRLDMVVLAGSLLLPLVAGIHDTLLFLGLVPGDHYFSAPSAMGTLLGSSFALTWRMVQGMRMIEHFNAELQEGVSQARRQLAETLAGQHAAALAQTRMAERMNMVRDLHDGLGMTLSSHMHALRGDAGTHAPRAALAALQEVSDDLRLIIETSSFDSADALAERLAPLRHRATRLLEAADIDVTWTLEGLEHCQLDGRRALDFMRVLQEALANVLKHSAATRVGVEIAAHGGELTLSVADDGRGMANEPARGATPGIGMRSMRTRAARLQGTLSLHSGGPGQGMRVVLCCPLEPRRAEERQEADIALGSQARPA